MTSLPHRAITITEILVLLVIIALLMAVAIPNFMRSRTRAKIAMVKEELSRLATAVENYSIDSGVWVREYSSRSPFFGDPVIPPGDRTVDILHWHLSSPIAYVDDAWIDDPFAADYKHLRFDRTRYTFHKYLDRWYYLSDFPRSGSHLHRYGLGPWPVDNSDADAETTNRLHFEFYGQFRIGSVGPDGNYFNNPGNLEQPLTFLAENIAYDPTNGLHSQGNIWRYRGSDYSKPRKWLGDNDQPPIQPGLLGAH